MAEYWDFQDDLHTKFDSETRIAVEYVPGSQTGTPRPFTAEENALADAAALAQTEATNRASIEQALASALDEIQATIDATNQTINANPAAHIKTLARAQRRAIRLLIRRFDGTA